MIDQQSTKPYLVRAIHQWCTDNGFTPYLSVEVDEYTEVPFSYVKEGEIVLNVSPMATQDLHLGNEFVQFQARFGGVPHLICVPVGRISAVYARENGQGMAFELTESTPPQSDEHSSNSPESGGSSRDKNPLALTAVPSSTSSESDEGGPSVDGETSSQKVSKKSSKRKKNHLTRVK